MTTACTIVARNYLPHARVLAESFLRHHRDGRFVVLLVDDEAHELETKAERFECKRLSDIGLSTSEIGRLAGIYDVTELATAVKPPLLSHLLSESDDAIYLDPDIKVFASLDEVSALAREHGIVLTPHTMVPVPKDGRRISSLDILGAGVYNLGFIAVGVRAMPFVAWWWDNTKREALANPQKMMFTDQRWIDFVPSFFSHYILKDPGYNVAYWNLHGRELAWTGTDYRVNERPLRFFHFSGFDHRRPYLLSKHQGESPRVLLSERPVLARICKEYLQDLRVTGIEQSPSLQYGWARLPGGLIVDKRIRSLYWTALVAHEQDDKPEPPNPFDARSAADFVNWLNEPEDGGPPGVSRYLLSIHRDRPDLRAHFPDLAGEGAARYAHWVLGDGVVQERIPPQLLPRVPDTNAVPRFAATSELRPGVNVAGYLNAELGIGEAARMMIRTLDRAAIPHSTITYNRTPSRQLHEFQTNGSSRAEHDINLLCINADQTPLFANEMGARFFEGRHTAGYWFWELEQFPETMYPGFQHVDEVWAATTFVTAAIERANRRPVYTVPIPVPELRPDRSLTREHFGLPPAFVFLFVFDFFSIVQRKNPIGLIQAFQRAFRHNEGPLLLLKSINGHKRLNDLEAVRMAAGDREDIRIVDEYRSAAERDALVTLCDCYVSLHRSEGLGLTMAEAMAAGKPVIATGYSGNLDFMTPENSFLVDYSTGSVPPGCDPYPVGAVWAEPSLDSAAEMMRRVVEQPAEAARRASVAQSDVVQRHGVAACAETLSRRVNAIHDNRKSTLPAPAAPGTPAEEPLAAHLDGMISSAKAMLTPDVGLPATARFRGLRLRMQKALFRALRAYWWQQRQIQTLIIDSISGSIAQSGAQHQQALHQVGTLGSELRTSHRETLNYIGALESDLRGQVDAIRTQIRAQLDRTHGMSEHQSRVETDVQAFQSSAARHLEALTDQGKAFATDMHTLTERLYAKPYMSDPDSLTILDERGQRILGFNASREDARDIYAGFEAIFRGSRELVLERARAYVPFLKKHEPILDVGCGRGELLEVLRESQLNARGVDLDDGMIAACRAKSLNVVQADALSYLTTLEDKSIGAIVAIELVEHLPYERFLEFLQQSRRCLVLGGLLIIETVNPHSIEAFKAFWTDLTHKAPIFPEVALALCKLQGFASGRVIFPYGSGDFDQDRRVCGEYAVLALNSSRDY